MTRGTFPWIQRPLAVALTALVLAAAVTAQERRSVAGRVVDARQRPVAAAVVTLTTPLAPHTRVAAPEVLTATTDATGQFRLEVLTGHSYTAGAVGANGVSRWHEGVRARQFVVQDLAAWGAAAPQRLLVVPMQAPGVVQSATLRDGRATVPAMPLDRLCVELCTGDGEVLAALDVATPEPGTPCVLTMPPPHRLRLRAHDATGAPLAGVRIEQRTLDLRHGGLFDECWREAWRPLGATDAAGHLDVVVALRGADWQQVFHASRPGSSQALAAILGGTQTIDARGASANDCSELHFTLAAERPLQGRIVRGSDAPLEAALWVEVTSLLTLPSGGQTTVPQLFPVQSDAQGAWRLPNAPESYATVRLLAPPELRQRLGMALPFVLAEGNAPAVLPTVSLAQLVSFDLQLQRSDGGPAEDAIVYVVPVDRRRWFVETWDPQCPCDRAGRAHLLLPAGEALLFCTDGKEYVEQVLDGRTPKLELRMAPLERSVWTVQSPDGNAAAGARLEFTAYGSAEVRETDVWAQARGAVAVSFQTGWNDGACADELGKLVLRTLPGSKLVMQLNLVHTSGKLENVRFAPGDRTYVLSK